MCIYNSEEIIEASYLLSSQFQRQANRCICMIIRQTQRYHNISRKGVIDCDSSLTTREAWTMPFTSQWQDLLRKIDSFSTARTAVGIIVIDISSRHGSTAANSNFTAACCHPLMTMLTAQCIASQQMSRRVFQGFATCTCVANTPKLQNFNYYNTCYIK